MTGYLKNLIESNHSIILKHSSSIAYVLVGNYILKMLDHFKLPNALIGLQ